MQAGSSPAWIKRARPHQAGPAGRVRARRPAGDGHLHPHPQGQSSGTAPHQPRVRPWDPDYRARRASGPLRSTSVT